MLEKVTWAVCPSRGAGACLAGLYAVLREVGGGTVTSTKSVARGLGIGSEGYGGMAPQGRQWMEPRTQDVGHGLADATP